MDDTHGRLGLHGDASYAVTRSDVSLISQEHTLIAVLYILCRSCCGRGEYEYSEATVTALNG